MKICLTSSSGGHFEQLLMLAPLAEDHDCFIITERTPYNKGATKLRTHWLEQVNRSNPLFVVPLVKNIGRTWRIMRAERPEIIISTGVLSTIPVCLIGKALGSRVIYIESYAKVKSSTLTGKLMSRFADAFYVQWPQMLSVFPKATYAGGVY